MPKRILLLQTAATDDTITSVRPIINGRSFTLNQVSDGELQAMIADLDRARGVLMQHVHDRP